MDVTGSAASVKLELHQGEKRVFTDSLSLHMLPGGWRIVDTFYYRH